MPTISNDRTMKPFRQDDTYKQVLLGTARVWVSLLKCRSVSDDAGTRKAYDRAVLALMQLPVEFRGVGYRFDMSQWREVRVEPGVLTKDMHCEHPWTKRLTKQLLWSAGLVALRRNLEDETIIAAVADILDARQDTVVLHQRCVDGVVSDRREDGLLKRYGGAVDAQAITLINRYSGRNETLATIKAKEEEVSAAVLDACVRLAGKKADWPESLVRVFSKATGSSDEGSHTRKIKRRHQGVIKTERTMPVLSKKDGWYNGEGSWINDAVVLAVRKWVETHYPEMKIREKKKDPKKPLAFCRLGRGANGMTNFLTIADKTQAVLVLALAVRPTGRTLADHRLTNFNPAAIDRAPHNLQLRIPLTNVGVTLAGIKEFIDLAWDNVGP